MKAPATPTTKKKPASGVVKGRTSAVVVTAKPAAKPAAKSSAKAAVKPTPKGSSKKPVPVQKPVVAKKAAPAAVAKPPAGKAGAKSAAQAPVSKAPLKKTAPAAPLPTTKPSAKLPAKAALKVPEAPPKAKAAVAAPVRKPVAAPKPAPIVVEPTPRPLGKRAAKKVMMEQMTQAAVIPTHAPDAAKATFFTSSERVMTPPVPSTVQKDPKRANNWKTLPVDQLTDPDVQAMPDAEYMNDVQLAFFRRKLSLLKDDMLANAGETTEHLREDTVVVPDPADRATIEEEHALELRTRDRERKLLKKIEQAIARIDSGEYGYCEETGEAIGVGRLMARPTASLSLEAQQRRELKQKMFGD